MFTELVRDQARTGLILAGIQGFYCFLHQMLTPFKYKRETSL